MTLLYPGHASLKRIILTKLVILLLEVRALLELVVVGHEDVEEPENGEHLEEGLHRQSQEVRKLQDNEANVVEDVLQVGAHVGF